MQEHGRPSFKCCSTNVSRPLGSPLHPLGPRGLRLQLSTGELGEQAWQELRVACRYGEVQRGQGAVVDAEHHDVVGSQRVLELPRVRVGYVDVVPLKEAPLSHPGLVEPGPHRVGVGPDEPPAPSSTPPK